MDAKSEYAEQLEHAEWKLKRLTCLEIAQFTCQRCKATGVPLQVHHLKYVRGRKAWEYDPTELLVCCENCHANIHRMQGELFQSVQILSDTLKLRRPTRPTSFDNGAVATWVKRRILSGPAQREAMRFAGWLCKSGTKDTEVIIRIMEEGLRLNPDSWYAYFAPGSAARETISNTVAINRAEAELKRMNREERAWIAQMKSS